MPMIKLETDIKCSKCKIAIVQAIPPPIEMQQVIFIKTITHPSMSSCSIIIVAAIVYWFIDKKIGLYKK